MSLEIYVIEDYLDIPKGSRLQNCVSVCHEGEEYWKGLSCSMYGSYIVRVPKRHCEIYDETKHDFMYKIKQYLAHKNEIDVETEERATLARLKLKYERE